MAENEQRAQALTSEIKIPRPGCGLSWSVARVTMRSSATRNKTTTKNVSLIESGKIEIQAAIKNGKMAYTAVGKSPMDWKYSGKTRGWNKA